jgi:hypothetical protein
MIGIPTCPAADEQVVAVPKTELAEGDANVNGTPRSRELEEGALVRLDQAG